MVNINPFKRVTVGNLFVILVFAVIAFQVIAKISTYILGTQDIRLGWVFTLIIGGLAILMPYILIIKKQGALERKDVFTIIILTGLLLTMIVYAPKFIPEIYSTLPHNEVPYVTSGLQTIQSVIGG